MPYKDKEIEKRYYSIGDVAKELNVATSLIRFWETQFEELQPKKNKKGNRVYTPEDLTKLKAVYYLVKEKGYTLSGAREALQSNKNAFTDKMEVVESLKKVRAFLEDLKKDL